MEACFDVIAGPIVGWQLEVQTRTKILKIDGDFGAGAGGTRVGLGLMCHFDAKGVVSVPLCARITISIVTMKQSAIS